LHDSIELVTASDIQDFCARDWGLIERLKSDCWVEQKAAANPSAAIELAAELFQYVRTLRPDWPNAIEREADLASHIRLAGMLHRVSQDRAR
jgi:hypothetical protein